VEKSKNYIVILAGGGGTRLWPKSRAKSPKQFLRLLNNKTLFQETFDRIKSSVPIANIYIVAGKNLVAEIKKETPEILDKNIIIEPAPKNTAPAIGLAAAVIAKKDKNALISTLAADHYIKEKSKFIKTLSTAQKAASKGGFIVTIGIKPIHAHTGFGYIHVGKKAARNNGALVFNVESFKEKPDKDTAQDYLASGEYFWNANINTYKVSSLLDSINRLFPQLSKVLKKVGKGESEQVVEKAWKQLPPEPIDTVILERAANVLMVPGDFAWFDVGDWATVYSILSSSPTDNVVLGSGESKHVSFDTQGCLLSTSNRLVALVGAKDLIIIDTPDAILVCPKNRSQEVKRLVEKLSSEKKETYL
jgi:mannose-1-phosphate guanylyltransferase